MLIRWARKEKKSKYFNLWMKPHDFSVLHFGNIGRTVKDLYGFDAACYIEIGYSVGLSIKLIRQDSSHHFHFILSAIFTLL